MSFLGIDTSNYTTSVSLVRNGKVEANLKKSVFVGEHQRGVRQSDALFCHIKNLPVLMEELGALPDLEAVGYSARPRDAEGSYMPCFLGGEAVARSIAAERKVKIFDFSHQAGHIRAALYSANALEIKDQPLIAFHVSGGTTEILLVEKGKIRLVGGTKDLTAGQAIDRIGVMLGLQFPCGGALEQMATGVLVPRVHPCVSGVECNLSGLENKAFKMKEEGASNEEIAAFTIEFVRKTIELLTVGALEKFGELPVLYAGGVMSCKLIQEDLKKRFHCYFAEPAFSMDNAAGVALLTQERFIDG